MATELTTVLQFLGDLVHRFYQISFWVANSWSLVVPIALLWMYDFMRRQQSNKKKVVYAGYSKISRAGFGRFLLLVGGYIVLYTYIWYSEIPNKALLNQLLLSGVVVYSVYFLRKGRDWQFIYAAAAGYAFFLVVPDLSRDLIAIAIETAENRPLAIFAGLFAYMGWRETAMETQVQREEAMRNRLNGLQREQGEVQMTITYVRISEAEGMFYRLFRYFMLTSFRGKTFLGISIPEEANIGTFDALDDVLLVDTQITDFYRVNQNEYKMVTKAVTLDSVQSEFYALVRSVGFTHEIKRDIEVSERFGLDLGRKIKPEVRYMLPKGVIRGSFIRNEFATVKSLRPDVSLEFDTQNSLGRPSSSTVEAPLTCTYEEREKEYYRTWEHLLEINIPSWLSLERLYTTSDNRISYSHYPYPMFEGLQILESCYKNIDIKRVAEIEYEDGTEYQYLSIENNNPDVNWSEVNVPVTNYRLPDGNDRIISSRDSLLSVSQYALDAKAVRYDPDSVHGQLSAIYDHEPGYLKITWVDIKDRCLVESPIHITRSSKSLNPEGVIWIRE